ncbi:malto-oligosyltrehalose trehalohydrolase [Arundinibacter roseus]|uniref:Malto-oligosyltrehalose trehalohydrolase n=1 Tax=Arundinibacter roseus TaxID=2070510 RepID=A0A4R4K7Y1_9BACT|nr:malto-oligosyltrehalose trehalohydrolase [Arundinibacter roseus]TDB63728.1 malto-oligosyltrehalose trehalohydrolase [Arundinibacter roseus]
MKNPGVQFLADAGACEFTVWAPEKERMVLHLVSPVERHIDMQKNEMGNFTTYVDDLLPGARYFFAPEGETDFPDPASHFQPEGVHGPSEVVDHRAYQWQDGDWHGLPFKDLIIYELHIGTFSQEGTCEAIIPHLDDLAATGINAIELMPVSQFAGDRNWGYDGVYPYSVQNSYGGPLALKKLVDACHQRGIAVFLDVVYNHIGPEGNYFSQFGPYFTDKYTTPWGTALNFDGEWADGVREYFVMNTIHWLENYHIDGLRMDAVHTIYDQGAVSIWDLLHSRIHQLQQRMGRQFYLIAESDLNSPHVVKTPEVGGMGFEAQWLDDFHHALYVLLDEEGKERYRDFGQVEQLAKAYTDGFVHSGEYVSFRKRKHGASSVGIRGNKFVVFNQNHDQIGNRVGGERLSVLVDFERLKVAAAAILLAPYVPMLFMGEEYAEDNPFFYFVSHSEPDLIRAVREGRKKEFEGFQWDVEPPEPDDEQTFQRSKIDRAKRHSGRHQVMLQWHQHLILMRRTELALQNFCKNEVRVHVLGQQGYVMHRISEHEDEHLICLFNLSTKKIAYTFPAREGQWVKILDSTEEHWREEPAKQSDSYPNELMAEAQCDLPCCSVAVYRLLRT